jgi:hypothetical protein
MLVRKELLYEVVTPLYLGGPHPRRALDESDDRRARDETRIRVRPIVAAWRQWLRAGLGGAWGSSPAALAAIHRAEQNFFGGVNEERGEASASRIRPRIVSASIAGLEAYSAEPQWRYWASYLGYGTGSRTERGTITEHPRFAIAPKSRFTLEVVCEESDWRRLCLVNYLWVNAGALGSRQRRGFGCLEWHDSEGGNPLPQNSNFIKDARAALAAGFPSPRTEARGEPEFDVLDPQWCRIKLSLPFDRWEDAMIAIRNQLRLEPRVKPGKFHLGEEGYGWRQGDGRFHHWTEEHTERGGHPYYPTRDKGEAWRIKQAGPRVGTLSPEPRLLNAAFGLPVAFAGWRLTVNAQIGRSEIRRPSPISFRVFRQDGRFRVAIQYFRSRFLPQNAHVEARGIRVATPDVWPYLDDFFAACEGEEVQL